jgi:NADH-quinone oxidoreductase subunit J
MIIQLLTGIFAIGSITTGFLVITAKNPIISVFYLVLTFVNASILLLIQGVEFLSLLLIIVYVGAIAILFLFVVMMLNIKRVELAGNTVRYVPVGFLIGLVFLSILKDKVGGDIALDATPFNYFSDFTLEVLNISTNTNIQALGDILYTHYSLYFIMSGIILLIAMIGAIILTISHEEEIKRQDIFSQIATEFDKTVVLKK